MWKIILKSNLIVLHVFNIQKNKLLKKISSQLNDMFVPSYGKVVLHGKTYILNSLYYPVVYHNKHCLLCNFFLRPIKTWFFNSTYTCAFVLIIKSKKLHVFFLWLKIKTRVLIHWLSVINESGTSATRRCSPKCNIIMCAYIYYFVGF